MTIMQKVINALAEKEINQHEFATLIFKIQDNKFIRFEKQYSINANEIK